MASWEFSQCGGRGLPLPFSGYTGVKVSSPGGTTMRMQGSLGWTPLWTAGTETGPSWHSWETETLKAHLHACSVPDPTPDTHQGSPKVSVQKMGDRSQDHGLLL